ncbi:hypothetical protein SAMN05519103_01791 [Rhizobiales bacterium GAS113]|nr:hypothetical protein SAMN05519103_01791 [Rhizobiales bacterium GAS113]
MGKLIDRYTLGARVAPVAVAAFSLFLAISAWIPFSQWPIKLLGGSALLIMAAFVLAQVTRDAGKAIEEPLWASWGGPPTVRMLRHRDSTFAPGIKSLIHRRLVELHVVDNMPSEADEEQDPEHADEIYKLCSDWLRNKALELKSKSPFDVVHSENISYGFRRNTLGIKPYGIAIMVAALAITVAAFFFGRQPLIELCAILLVGAYLLLAVTPNAVKRAADEYSKRLLNAVQAIPISKNVGPKRQSGEAR